MMLLTVMLNLLATSTAIRVPTAWPEQATKAANLNVAQNDYPLDIPFESHRIDNQPKKANNNRLYTTKLEQPSAVVHEEALRQNNKRPTGSYEYVIRNNAKIPDLTNKHISRKPDVKHTVMYSRNKPQIAHHTNEPQKNNQHKIYYNHSGDNRGASRTRNRYNKVKNPPFSQPILYGMHNLPQTSDGWMPIVGHDTLYKIEQTFNGYVNNDPNQPNNSINRRHSPYVPHSDTKHHVVNKNYRDDHTHETASTNDDVEKLPETNEDSEEPDGEISEEINDKLPPAELENPSEVPTKPIYPGEGLWAVRGLKHRPFIRKQTYTRPLEEDESQPEGYQTFENAKPTFERQHSRFQENLRALPLSYSPVEYLPSDNNKESEDEENEDQREADEETDGFVPVKTLAQVRKTETEEHLPNNPEDARLREVIKDSRIHTVYTEEGYEDIAYDHAGHEKNAEDSEGQAEFNKDATRTKTPKRKKAKLHVDVAKEFENYEKSADEAGEEDAEISASSYNFLKPDRNPASKKFAARKENVTTEIKNMNGNNMELEITSEIKIMTQPNNVSTAHKFVKIVPKLKVKQNLSKTDPLTAYSSNSGTYAEHRRHKRFVNDFHKVDVNKDFFDAFVIKKPKSKIVITTEKYPYYKIQSTSLLNKNSPLRYGENLDNIPKKRPGRMSFYEQSRISECPEIPRNVNPIPDRIKKAQEKGMEASEDEYGDGYAEQPDVPRLRNLGDKIDCLKERLFGENPLDSPIFQETEIEVPESIFKDSEFVNNIKNTYVNPEPELKEVVNAGLAPLADYSRAYEKSKSKDTYLLPNNREDYENEDKYNEEESNVRENHIKKEETDEDISRPSQNEVILRFTTEPQTHSQVATESTTTAPSTAPAPSTTSVSTTTALNHFLIRILEKPNVVPKHIYDQIDIALNLDDETTTSAPVVQKPNDNFEHFNGTTEPINTLETILPTTEQMASTNNNHDDLIILGPKQIYDQVERMDTDGTDLESNHRQPKLLERDSGSNADRNSTAELYDLQNSVPSTTLQAGVHDSLPETAALRVVKKRRMRPQSPTVQIFDVNKYLPTPLPTLVTYLTPNTVLPKYKTISEVFYKDEIKPNEQLNVFSDVISNIKNTPQEVLKAEGSENFEIVDMSEQPVVKYRKIKVPQRKVRIKQNQTEAQSSDNIYITSSTSTSAPATTHPRNKNKYKNHKVDSQIYEEYLQAIKNNPNEKNSLQYASTHKPDANQDSLSSTTTSDVLGLSPPSPTGFASIYSLSANQIGRAVPKTINSYPIFGLKPPNSRQPLIFPDFSLKQHNRVRQKNVHHRIHKRSPFKPSYSEIKRNRFPQPVNEQATKKEEEEEEDDYVPRRNRNFHYDVENRKVIYTKPAKEEEEEEVVPELVEEEEEEEYLTLKPDPPKPKFVVITTERNGPSFLDFVHVLKSNANYTAIEEPKPKEKPEKAPTTAADLKEGESTTTKQVQTAIPQFLSIVSKLKSDKDYVPIKEEKAKPSTTTVPSADLEYEEELEGGVEENEEPDGNVKNSPGSIGSSPSARYDRTQIFDISEYLPQPKNYSPKTVIDYSKYKTIQRAPVTTRHNLSSRYNSDDDLPLKNSDTTQTPILASNENSKTSDPFELNISSEEIGEKVTESVTTTTKKSETTESATLHTTSQPALKVRGSRRRLTTTTSAPSSTTISATTAATTSKKRSRHRFRSTTTTEPLLEETHSQTQRVVHRRIPVERRTRENQSVPPNHKAFYTPIVEDKNAITERPVVHRKRKVSRVIGPHKTQLPEAKDANKGINKTEVSVKEQLAKKEDVQVFRRYDPTKKHGGNYRRALPNNATEAAEVSSTPLTMYEIENSKEVRRLSDVVPKPFAFYSDPTLPKSVNQLSDTKVAEELPHDLEEEFPPIVKEKAEGDNADEIKINFDKNSETATKKPVHFVKDPSKRLYYYAPVK